MKVLHVGPAKFSRASGVPKSICCFATAQAQIGLKVGLLNSVPLQTGVKMEEIPRVCVLEGPPKRHFNPWFISAYRIVQIREEFGVPDVINFHSTYIPFHLALARRCRQVGWPYIITAHGGMTYLAQNTKRVKKSFANFLGFRSYIRGAAAIHALSQGEAEEICALFEVKKIITVPNGVEEYLLEARNRLAAADLGGFVREGDLLLGFVGRINIYGKGLDLLLEAMAILKLQARDLRCKLFLIGPFKAKKDERFFYSAIESLGLKETVKYLGPKYGEEKLRYFLSCDVFVNTSRSEGMPMAVLEAMALGCPCLVTPGTRVADIVKEAGGWACQANPKSIAQTIESICERRDSLKALRQRSQELIRSRFTWPKVAQRLSEEYEKIIKQDNR